MVRITVHEIHGVAAPGRLSSSPGDALPARSFVVPPVDTVTYGPGAFEQLGTLVEKVGGTRVLAVLSGSLVDSPAESALHAALGDRLVGTYSRTAQHVPRSSVLEATEVARRGDVDLVVSLGGGTPIDCAKGVALALGVGIETAAQFDDYRIRFTYPDTRIVPAIEAPLVPHIAVPTTLSGGEHTALCGITDDLTRSKDGFTHPALQPRAVILDPAITAGTPGWLWAASGLRAVDHAVEGILSIRHMPVADALGAEALRLLAANLARSADDPHDEAARTDCLLGTWLSIFALTNVGVGLSHSIGHQLAAEYDLLHGVTSAIMLPLVMEFTLEQTAPRLRLVAEALGTDTRDLDATGAAKSAVAAVQDLIRALGVPHTISAVAEDPDKLPRIADHVMNDASVAACPRPVTREDVLELLRAAW
jgi:alcohol dehydrogenase class IV